jgi:hypothetical protein
MDFATSTCYKAPDIDWNNACKEKGFAGFGKGGCYKPVSSAKYDGGPMFFREPPSTMANPVGACARTPPCAKGASEALARAAAALGIGALAAAAVDQLSRLFSNSREPTESHHIVAQGATNVRAKAAQDVLLAVGIDRYADPSNLVPVPKSAHRRIHTNVYYESINEIMLNAYGGGVGDAAAARMRVYTALEEAQGNIATDPFYYSY